METRKGKHKEYKTLFGAYVTPEVKALAEMAMEITHTSFTDMVLNGINQEAVKAKILVKTDDGLKIAPKFKDAYDLLVQMTKEKIDNRKRN